MYCVAVARYLESVGDETAPATVRVINWKFGLGKAYSSISCREGDKSIYLK